FPDPNDNASLNQLYYAKWIYPAGITSGWLYLPQKPMCHFNLGNLMDVQEWHITNRICRNSGFHGQFDRSSLLWEMIVAYFYWRGWFRAVLPFFQGDMTLRCGPYSLTLPILNILSLRKQRKAIPALSTTMGEKQLYQPINLQRHPKLFYKIRNLSYQHLQTHLKQGDRQDETPIEPNDSTVIHLENYIPFPMSHHIVNNPSLLQSKKSQDQSIEDWVRHLDPTRTRSQPTTLLLLLLLGTLCSSKKGESIYIE
ncbi:hypothetical protein J6590_104973, partial [Homalodisca vitripennis]